MTTETIELCRFVIDFVETHEPGTPQIWQQCDGRTYRWQ